VDTAARTSLSFRVLDAARPADRHAWLDLWHAWPARDVNAHPGYVALFARPADRVLCASARLAEGGILYPFVLRPLAAEPWASPDAPEWDMTGPYGYAGPFAWGADELDAEAFWTAFDRWASDTHVVCSFDRLSPFAEQRLPRFPGDIHPRGTIIVRRLDLTEEELRASYENKVRRNVRRATEAGLRVEVDPEASRRAEFQAVYASTMDRRNASDAYRFPAAFFDRLFHDLAAQVLLVHAVKDGRVVSSDLCLLSARVVYAFLGGTEPDGLRCGANDLVKHETFRWCLQRGMSAYVLGGSHREGDGLRRYKLSFAPDGERPFHVGVRTFDDDRLERLAARRRAWSASRGTEPPSGSHFFPPYRG